MSTLSNEQNAQIEQQIIAEYNEELMKKLKESDEGTVIVTPTISGVKVENKQLEGLRRKIY